MFSTCALKNPHTPHDSWFTRFTRPQLWGQSLSFCSLFCVHSVESGSVSEWRQEWWKDELRCLPLSSRLPASSSISCESLDTSICLSGFRLGTVVLSQPVQLNTWAAQCPGFNLLEVQHSFSAGASPLLTQSRQDKWCYLTVWGSAICYFVMCVLDMMKSHPALPVVCG